MKAIAASLFYSKINNCGFNMHFIMRRGLGMKAYLLDDEGKIVGCIHVKKRRLSDIVEYGTPSNDDFQVIGNARLVKKKGFKDQIRGKDLTEYYLRPDDM